MFVFICRLLLEPAFIMLFVHAFLGRELEGIWFNFMAHFACLCNLFPPALTTWPCPKAWPRLVIVYYWGSVFILVAVRRASVFSFYYLVGLGFHYICCSSVVNGWAWLFMYLFTGGDMGSLCFCSCILFTGGGMGSLCFSLLWGLYVGCMLLFIF